MGCGGAAAVSAAALDTGRRLAHDLDTVLSLVVPIVAVMVLAACLLAFLAWAYGAPSFASRRISPMPPLKVSPRQRLLHIVGNSTLSLLFVISMVAALYGFAFHTGPASS